MRTTRLATVLVLLVVGRSHAAGLLAPTDHTLPPLRITDHLVDVEIRDGVALTTVTQTFRNDTKRRLEATYVFPLPENADLTDFQMSFNGKMVKGQVLPAEEAARIYESIVRQARDPGLIEFIGRRLLRMRVFPVEPESETTIEVRYQQVCRPVSGMLGYHYPLRTRASAGQAYGTVRFAVRLATAAPLKSIWSPTHAVEIVRANDERTAQIAYEANGGSLEEDFLLLYDTDASDLGLSVVAHRASSDAAGHVVLMLTPKQLWPDETREPQDVVFVVDTSGSMAGDKITQAKSALGFCIDRLDESDRFTVVRFSTGYDLFSETLRSATPDSRAEARVWIDGFTAAGGTNIADTLRAVAGLAQTRAEREQRPFVVVFLTDGRGNRPPEAILSTLAEATKGAATLRVFPFGVGHDVNTKLLDRLASTYTGRTTYVQPGENLELVLGDFFGVISRPVLTNLRLRLPDIGATERFPATLGDLYHGQQIVVAARYTRDGVGDVTLTATRRGEPVEYVWRDVAFTSTPEAGYVPSVWAGRKIAYLIDQIRTHGESAEMIDEVLTLSRQYGIQTPYSSWLVDPERAALVLRDRMGGAGGAPVDWPRPTPGSALGRPGVIADAAQAIEAGEYLRYVAPEAEQDAGTSALRHGDEFDDLDLFLAGNAVTEASGRAANLIARKNVELRELSSRDGERLDRRVLARRRLGDRWYNRIGPILVDEGFGAETEVTIVRFASEAYFELVRLRPDLRAALASGRQVMVVLGSENAVLVSDRAGTEHFSDDQREHLGLELR